MATAYAYPGSAGQDKDARHFGQPPNVCVGDVDGLTPQDVRTNYARGPRSGIPSAETTVPSNNNVKLGHDTNDTSTEFGTGKTLGSVALKRPGARTTGLVASTSSASLFASATTATIPGFPATVATRPSRAISRASLTASPSNIQKS